MVKSDAHMTQTDSKEDHKMELDSPVHITESHDMQAENEEVYKELTDDIHFHAVYIRLMYNI